LYHEPTGVRNARQCKPRRAKALPIIGCIAVVSLTFLTYRLSRAEAIERLFAGASGEDSRTDFWVVSIDLIWKYFPWGSGSGSFVEAFQIVEPARLLDATYLNRAHNDWVETAVTFGLPGIVALAAAAITFAVRSYRLWRCSDGSRRAIAYGRLASVMIAIIAIASATDYPLRTPTMMGVFAICILWLSEAGRERSTLVAIANKEA
jgi:O-antigen ligase